VCVCVRARACVYVLVCARVRMVVCARACVFGLTISALPRQALDELHTRVDTQSISRSQSAPLRSSLSQASGGPKQSVPRKSVSFSPDPPTELNTFGFEEYDRTKLEDLDEDANRIEWERDEMEVSVAVSPETMCDRFSLLSGGGVCFLTAHSRPFCTTYISWLAARVCVCVYCVAGGETPTARRSMGRDGGTASRRTAVRRAA